MDTTIDRHPHGASSRPSFAGDLTRRFAARLGAGIRAIQYSRMLQAMSVLSDEQLGEIGLSRSDIPAHARACVYGPGA